jgi:hypothetical protein
MRVIIAIIIASLFIIFTCYADEIYVEGKTSDGKTITGYLETDDYDYAEGYLEDENGNQIFVEGKIQDDTVWIESPDQSETYELYIDN